MNSHSNINPFPSAMDPPKGKVTAITAEMINSAVEMSRKSPRGRIIMPFHKSNNALLHRMLNAIQPYSYIQPHCHLNPPKTETILLLRGSLAFITFNKKGKMEAFFKLAHQSGNIGIDTEPDIYHTYLALEKDTVLFEMKPGPYQKSSDKDFAQWAPPESAPNCREYLESLYKHAGRPLTEKT